MEIVMLCSRTLQDIAQCLIPWKPNWTSKINHMIICKQEEKVPDTRKSDK